MPALFYYSHSNMTLQSYRIIREKQEKSFNEDVLFYRMCQTPNCDNLRFRSGDVGYFSNFKLNFSMKSLWVIMVLIEDFVIV